MSKNKNVDNDLVMRRINFIIELFIEHTSSVKSLEGYAIFKQLCADFDVDVSQAWEQYKCYEGSNIITEAEN